MSAAPPDISVDLSDIDFPSGYAAVKRGVSASDVEALVQEGLLSIRDIERVIPKRTLQRRVAQAENLRLEEIDGLTRLLRIRHHALRVFEDLAPADEWLNTANPALGNEIPFEMALTDIGGREVEALLIRIEHGVYD